MRKTTMKLTTLATALAAALALAAGTAAAQTKLRVGDSLPVNHFFAEQATKFWMQEVTKKTSGAVEFEYYPAEQLGKAKDLMSLTQSGVIDIGYVVPTYVQEKMPLTAVAELPGTYASSCEGTLAYWKLARDNGVLARRDYQPNGMRVMFAIAMPPYQVFSGNRMVDSVSKIQGMKLRSVGGAMDTLVSKLKGVPVRMTAPELHESLTRGTVDGMVFPSASVLSYDLAGLVKSGTQGENFGSAVLTYMISENRFKSLPQNVRDAMLEAGDAATRRICAYADREVANDLDKIRAKGAKIAPLPDAERKQLAEITGAVQKEWAESMDKRRLPGSEALDAFRAALK